MAFLPNNYFYSPSGPEAELTFHDGTVRDIVFMQDISNRSSLLVSAGAGDSKIYVTDCETAMPIKAMAGHSGNDKPQCEEIRFVYARKEGSGENAGMCRLV